MSATLSTHVLDLAHGCPAAGIQVRLWQGDLLLVAATTNDDGRCPEIGGIELVNGAHRLSFAVADYFRAKGAVLSDPPFLDEVHIDFAVGGEGHYHVPLLASPFGYSTYRGS
jgi:5-hydroxyisourate hydrolase